MSMLAKIKGRGYWEIVIRPTRFVEHRMAQFDLGVVDRIGCVEFRGWAFPPKAGASNVVEDRIEHHVNFRRHVEEWRLYRSGLFVYFGGLRDDWDEQDHQPNQVRWVQRPGKILGVADTVWTLTEAFEFAARLALSEAGGDRMHVSATVHHLKGRRLHMEISSRDLSPRPPLEGLDVLPQSGDFAREQLVAESKALARGWAREVLRRFGWDASLDILAEIQSHFDRK